MNDLLIRIAQMEAALKPFADAAQGFKKGDAQLMYMETDEQAYVLFCGDDSERELTVQDLLNAAKVLGVEIKV